MRSSPAGGSGASPFLPWSGLRPSWPSSTWTPFRRLRSRNWTEPAANSKDASLGFLTAGLGARCSTRSSRKLNSPCELDRRADHDDQRPLRHGDVERAVRDHVQREVAVALHLVDQRLPA